MTKHLIRLFTILVSFAAVAPVLAAEPTTSNTSTSDKSNAAPPIHPALVQVEEDPRLPRVLLIGDSISMGYTPTVRKLLGGKANVQHPPENCRSTRQIVERIDQYLGKQPWDVIHFNSGIHDITYLNSAGKVAGPGDGGHIQVSLDDYRANLEKIVERLKKTGATLIWSTTTPVTKPIAFRKLEDIVLHNEAANQIMREHGIETNDLHRRAAELDESFWNRDGVHLAPAGYDELAKNVATAIEAALAKRPK